MNYQSNIQPKRWCELCDSVWIPAKLNFEPCLGDDLTRWQVNEEVYRSCDLQWTAVSGSLPCGISGINWLIIYSQLARGQEQNVWFIIELLVLNLSSMNVNIQHVTHLSRMFFNNMFLDKNSPSSPHVTWLWSRLGMCVTLHSFALKPAWSPLLCTVCPIPHIAQIPL